MFEENNSCKEKKNWLGRLHYLHYVYVILILILILVAFISYYHCDEQDLVSQVGFAASISSIILSVLAIFMTLLSNNSIGGMLHKVRDMHDAVNSIPKTLNESVSNLKDTTSDLRDINSDVNKSLSALGLKLQELENHLNENDKKFQEIVDNITSSNTRENSGIEMPSEALVNQYLYVMSLNGLIILYAFYLYKEEQKSGIFNIEEFVKRFDGLSVNYIQGILVASTSVNILHYVVEKGTVNYNIKELSLSDYIKKDSLTNAIKKCCEDICENYKGSPSYYNVDVLVNKVRDYIETL